MKGTRPKNDYNYDLVTGDDIQKRDDSFIWEENYNLSGKKKG
jgi:hypothetical protein